ncbi:MAG: sorbosone dehydrogenase family protein [Gammaproteobacteria bacterium]|nr:sorbosone dehydrogenase family protein [Gammaproteobacteria bacterium]NNF48544.1 sorbosone dehydrogenase family protein [Woeseiaceae bacterium]MBT8095186.1 sorbosone dehydrogenase family protein [Gammaproteobacteria bacterium]MBT8105344.1 sorbosone dehydrogenase family protein [Gammaproteobacteria bacterium]NNK25358.1 sorbosone dehydrogenase family protein [Woeseiaceae bacterium]
MVSRLAATILVALSAPLAFASLDEVQLPPGFAIEVYADVPRARSLVFGDQGTLFVSTRKARSIYAVVESGDGSTRTIELADNLSTPNGIAFKDGDLYVAEIDRVLRYRDIEDNLESVPDPEVLDIDLPSERRHGWRYIGFGPDGMLYISIGAPCNVCDDEGFAEIIRVNPDGSGRETYASGIRNSVGFTWHPETGDLWFTDNGRDMMGDDIPPCELNHASRPGQHFGFPYCHGGDIPDPKYGKRKSCEDYSAPVQKLGPHVAPLGLTFYTGDMFPPEYRGQIFIAEHGSWNRSKKIGYRVTLVTLDGDEAVRYEPFAEGWLQNEQASGRPVDLLVKEDGSLLVSDDFAGKIYRISYSGGTQ